MSVGEPPLLPVPPGHVSTLWQENKRELCPERHTPVEEQLFLPGKCALPNLTELMQSKPKTLILILMVMWPVWKHSWFRNKDMKCCLNVKCYFNTREEYSLRSKGHLSYPSTSNSLSSPHRWIFCLLEAVITKVNFLVAFQIIAKLFYKAILGENAQMVFNVAQPFTPTRKTNTFQWKSTILQSDMSTDSLGWLVVDHPQKSLKGLRVRTGKLGLEMCLT